LPDDVRRRLLKLAGSRATKAGEILIDARNHRTRERNREEARERLVELLRRANRRPTPRKKTKPGRAAKERRIQEKKQRGRTKESRKPVRTGE
jgi:ribosome-associated protein